ncbi:PASTA domain-containing protein [Streptacidiphilus monticola]
MSGKTVAEATAALRAAGLAVGSSSQQQASDSVPAGRVVGTDPPAGRRLSPNSPVNLIVSSGSQPVDLPDVVGEPVDQATSDLQDAGFNVRLDPNQVYSDQDAGTIAAQSPNGSSAQRGATVTLTVSKGQEQVQVPDVGGMTEKQARRTLERAGFKVRAITVIPLGKPTVHNQSPGADSQAAKGSTVTLWLYP